MTFILQRPIRKPARRVRSGRSTRCERSDLALDPLRDWEHESSVALPREFPAARYAAPASVDARVTAAYQALEPIWPEFDKLHDEMDHEKVNTGFVTAGRLLRPLADELQRLGAHLASLYPADGGMFPPDEAFPEGEAFSEGAIFVVGDYLVQAFAKGWGEYLVKQHACEHSTIAWRLAEDDGEAIPGLAEPAPFPVLSGQASHSSIITAAALIAESAFPEYERPGSEMDDDALDAAWVEAGCQLEPIVTELRQFAHQLATAYPETGKCFSGGEPYSRDGRRGIGAYLSLVFASAWGLDDATGSLDDIDPISYRLEAAADKSGMPAPSPAGLDVRTAALQAAQAPFAELNRIWNIVGGDDEGEARATLDLARAVTPIGDELRAWVERLRTHPLWPQGKTGESVDYLIGSYLADVLVHEFGRDVADDVRHFSILGNELATEAHPDLFAGPAGRNWTRLTGLTRLPLLRSEAESLAVKYPWAIEVRDGADQCGEAEHWNGEFRYVLYYPATVPQVGQ
jgi:hypothetical protein